jgi:hypothetical protein
MPTFKELVDEVSLSLAGFTLRQDRSTHLTSSINSNSLTISVASADNIAKGIIQIDDELIWVDSFDRTSGVLTIPPYGRGYLGSLKATHYSGSQVTLSPTFPRVNIKKTINDTIRAVYPNIYAVGSTTFAYNPSQITYTLPNEVETILGISHQTIGPTQEWVPVRSWRVDPMANTGSFNSNNSLSIYDNIVPGRTVQVFYTKEPSTFELDDDDFETTTGLNASAKDIIIYGAAYRMASLVEPGRLTFTSPEADLQSSRLQYGVATNTARYLLALYQQRLDEESRKLSGRFPIRLHYTR